MSHRPQTIPRPSLVYLLQSFVGGGIDVDAIRGVVDNSGQFSALQFPTDLLDGFEPEFAAPEEPLLDLSSFAFDGAEPDFDDLDSLPLETSLHTIYPQREITENCESYGVEVTVREPHLLHHLPPPFIGTASTANLAHPELDLN